jgi:signal transduction histidine kinase/CheY-like chemotaxis protein
VVCEFCGGQTRELARTTKTVWLGCRRCDRSWKEDAQAVDAAVEISEAPAAASVRSKPWMDRLDGRGLLIAVLAVAVAFSMRLALKPLMGDTSPFLLFTPAVVIAAAYGGLVPALVATGSSALLGTHFFLRTLDGPVVETWDRVALFLLTGGVITITTELLRSGRRRLADSLWREQVSRAQAEAANQVKDEFLALASHELQTPLTVVLGWTSMIRERHLHGRVLHQALDTIDRNARLASKLVGDVLETSRIVGGVLRLDAEVISLANVVAAALEQVRPAVDAKELTIVAAVPDEEWFVSADPVRLQQVFTNLLSNAIKFTPAGGRITVEMRRAGSRASVSISDTGVGISPEFVPRLFQRFEQDPQTLRHSRRGLGLGLSIARHFVERHGGTVHAASDGPGKGSTFTVDLPLQEHPAAAPQIGRDGLASDALRSISILLVEDDDDTRVLLTALLARFGAHVVPAASVAEALRVLERMHPDVMLSDLWMPTADGLALIHDVRHHADVRVATVPAASISASARIEDRDRALAAGYQLHLQKPVAPQDLAAAVLTLARSTDGVTH